MISLLIPFLIKAFLLSIIFCGLIFGYNYFFDASVDVWWGIVPAVVIPSFGSKKSDNSEES